VYARIGGVVFPWRDVSWLALYCSWPLLALAVVGAPIAWYRGGDAVRVAGYAWMIATVLFVLNPRVSAYQPWAIRRFLPLVIPGIALAGASAVAWIGAGPRRARRLLAAGAVAVIGILTVRPVLRARAIPYYEGSFAQMGALAARFPADAIVAIDSGFADLQLQVPLWLGAGRETILLRQGGRRWQSVMQALAASGRPVFWIGDRNRPLQRTGDVGLRPLAPDLDFDVVVPDAPGDTTPSGKITRRLPLRIYGVAVGEGNGFN
jgi:hypothetical protein